MLSAESVAVTPLPHPQGCIRREGTSEALDRRLEEVAKAVGSGYCRLQLPLRPALAVCERLRP